MKYIKHKRPSLTTVSNTEKKAGICNNYVFSIKAKTKEKKENCKNLLRSEDIQTLSDY